MQGIPLGTRGARNTAIVYVDDITINATRPEDTDIIQETLHEYKKANGARINIHKSSTIALGS